MEGNYFTFYSGDRLWYRTSMGKWVRSQYPLQYAKDVKETEVRVTKELKVATSDKVAETALEIMKHEVDKRNANISNFAAASKTKQILTGYLGSKLAESLSKATEHFGLTKDAMKHLEENEQKWAMFARSINERGKADFDNATIKGQATMLSSSKKFQSMVVESLSKQGYNTMTDLAGVGGNGAISQETTQALYLFDRSGTTENVKSRNLPTGSKYRNEYTAYNNYYNQLNKR